MPRKKTRPKAKREISPLHPDAVARFEAIDATVRQAVALLADTLPRSQAIEKKLDNLTAVTMALDQLLRTELDVDPMVAARASQ